MSKMEKGTEKLVKGDEKQFSRAVCGFCKDSYKIVTYYAFEPLTEMSYTVCNDCYAEWKKKKVWRVEDMDYKFDSMIWEAMECYVCNTQVVARYVGKSFGGNAPRILYFCENCLVGEDKEIDLINALLYMVDTDMVLEMPDVEPLVKGLKRLLQTKGKIIESNSAKPFIQKYLRTFNHIFFSDYAYIKQNYRIMFKDKSDKFTR